MLAGEACVCWRKKHEAALTQSRSSVAIESSEGFLPSRKHRRPLRTNGGRKAALDVLRKAVKMHAQYSLFVLTEFPRYLERDEQLKLVGK
jgi:hypothetical protein